MYIWYDTWWQPAGKALCMHVYLPTDRPTDLPAHLPVYNTQPEISWLWTKDSHGIHAYIDTYIHISIIGYSCESLHFSCDGVRMVLLSRYATVHYLTPTKPYLSLFKVLKWISNICHLICVRMSIWECDNYFFDVICVDSRKLCVILPDIRFTQLILIADSHRTQKTTAVREVLLNCT